MNKFTGEPTKDKCQSCEKRRSDGFVWCTCGNRLNEPVTILVDPKVGRPGL